MYLILFGRLTIVVVYVIHDTRFLRRSISIFTFFEVLIAFSVKSVNARPVNHLTRLNAT